MCTEQKNMKENVEKAKIFTEIKLQYLITKISYLKSNFLDELKK